MIRIVCVMLLLATPASAWQARFDGMCRLTHNEPTGEVELTFDPTKGLYSIAISRAAGTWQPAEVFSILFAGPRELVISTNRHSLDGDTVTATDTGFGNVLYGLEFNDSATAILGDQRVTVSLDGAAP